MKVRLRSSEESERLKVTSNVTEKCDGGGIHKRGGNSKTTGTDITDNSNVSKQQQQQPCESTAANEKTIFSKEDSVDSSDSGICLTDCSSPSSWSPCSSTSNSPPPPLPSLLLLASSSHDSSSPPPPSSSSPPPPTLMSPNDGAGRPVRHATKLISSSSPYHHHPLDGSSGLPKDQSHPHPASGASPEVPVNGRSQRKRCSSSSNASSCIRKVKSLKESPAASPLPVNGVVTNGTNGGGCFTRRAAVNGHHNGCTDNAVTIGGHTGKLISTLGSLKHQSPAAVPNNNNLRVNGCVAADLHVVPPTATRRVDHTVSTPAVAGAALPVSTTKAVPSATGAVVDSGSKATTIGNTAEVRHSPRQHSAVAAALANTTLRYNNNNNTLNNNNTFVQNHICRLNDGRSNSSSSNISVTSSNSISIGGTTPNTNNHLANTVDCARSTPINGSVSLRHHHLISGNRVNNNNINNNKTQQQQQSSLKAPPPPPPVNSVVNNIKVACPPPLRQVIPPSIPSSTHESSLPGATFLASSSSSASSLSSFSNNAKASSSSFASSQQQTHGSTVLRFPAAPVKKDQAEVCRWKGCNQVMDANTSLLEHIQAQHVEDQVSSKSCESFRCLWVGCKVYERSSCSVTWLERHVLTHGGHKPFKCIVDGCGQRFTSQTGLGRHVNQHFNSPQSTSASTMSSTSVAGGVNGASTVGGSVGGGGAMNGVVCPPPRLNPHHHSPSKLIRKHGRKFRFRRRPWSARMFDFFDVSIMEQLRWGLVCVNSTTRGRKLFPTNKREAQDNKLTCKLEPMDGEDDAPVHTRTRSAANNNRRIVTGNCKISLPSSMNQDDVKTTSPKLMNGFVTPPAPSPPSVPTKDCHIKEVVKAQPASSADSVCKRELYVSLDPTAKDATPVEGDKSFDDDCVTLFPTVMCRRVTLDGRREELINWSPTNVIDDGWMPEGVTPVTLPLSSLCPAGQNTVSSLCYSFQRQGTTSSSPVTALEAGGGESRGLVMRRRKRNQRKRSFSSCNT